MYKVGLLVLRKLTYEWTLPKPNVRKFKNHLVAFIFESNIIILCRKGIFTIILTFVSNAVPFSTGILYKVRQGHVVSTSLLHWYVKVQHVNLIASSCYVMNIVNRPVLFTLITFVVGMISDKLLNR